MEFQVDVGVERRADEFFDRVGRVLRNKKRRASFAVYAMGLFGDAERKSAEPIAARACADPDHADAAHQRLLHFLSVSRWSDRDVRREAACYALDVLTEREPVQTWIIDDTGFLKQGTHSVGVQRQYTGSAGKVTNCQVGVSLTLATLTEHLPIDFELYLPRSWTDDRARRREARIPDSVVFKTKPQLALGVLRRAVEDDLPRGVVLADSGYGNDGAFRAGIRELGLDYAVEVQASTCVYKLDAQGNCRTQRRSVRDLATQLGRRGFRRVTWREGTKKSLSARFAMRRVVVAHERADGDHREHVWLLMEWRDDESKPTKFHLATLPDNLPMKYLVNFVKQRWRTERMYEDLKGELGLDHFEGRRFPGWHHHVSAVLCCNAFLTSERVRRFPPARTGTPHTRPLPRAA